MEMELFEETAIALRELCGQFGTTAIVMLHSQNWQSRRDLLSDPCSCKYAKGLDWLNNPDSDTEYAFHQTGSWGSPYEYVVLLEGPNLEMLGLLASQVLRDYGKVGLVCFAAKKEKEA